MNKVPAHYQGVWKRLSLRDAGGTLDMSTQVYWLQTSSLYCDIRIPADRPDFSGTHALVDFDDRGLRMLACQQGFAGVLEAEGEICRWHRHVDYQPFTGRDDVGQMRFEGDLLIEHGVHANYTEEWQRLAGPEGDVVALELLTETDAAGYATARNGFLLVFGDYFMFALARTAALPPAPSLTDVLDVIELDRERMRRLLDFEISFGVRRSGAVLWEITRSTLPFREGESLLTPNQTPVHDSGRRWLQAHVGGTGDITRSWIAHEYTPNFSWFD